MEKISFTDYFHSLIEVEEPYQAPKKLMEILYNKERREKLFMKLLEFKEMDVDYDWFHEYFQDEHADRKNKKQDFTPNEVGEVLSKIVSSNTYKDNYYEVAAGTGGLMIQHWKEQRYKESPFTYDCWEHFHTVEELSDRTIPFLILNMMIRGMNGIVIHGESISRNCKGIFFIQNFYNNHLGFSDLNVMPYTDEVAEHFSVNFEWVVNSTDQTTATKRRKSTKGHYPDHIERSWYDKEYQEKISQILTIRDLEKESLEKLEKSNLEEEVKEFIKYFGIY